MGKRQHHKGRKRPRSWHRTAREGRQWERAVCVLEVHIHLWLHPADQACEP
jgi:hypothetical protein